MGEQRGLPPMQSSLRRMFSAVAFLLLWSSIVLVYGTQTETVGILVYINPVPGASGLDRDKLIFQQLATSILIAIHHINTRNATIVGNENMAKIPIDFTLQYKIADTHSEQTGAVKALLDWRCQDGTQDYTCGTVNTTQLPGPTPIYQAKSSDVISGIVGPFRSEESEAVCNLASALGMNFFPITSYASVLSELSDKVRFPYFSRTVPSLAVNAAGIIKVFKQFGWTRCGFMYIDDPWGNSFASDFLYQASISNILVLTAVKFADMSVADVETGVEALRSSGVRVFVYLEDTGNNVEAVLLSAAKAGIAGKDGYAWVTFEQNDPEIQLALAATPAAVLRPLLFGWLNIFGYAPSDTLLSRFQDIFAESNSPLVYDPLVDMPSSGFVAPTLTAYHLYAYDRSCHSIARASAAHVHAQAHTVLSPSFTCTLHSPFRRTVPALPELPPGTESFNYECHLSSPR